MKFKHTVMLALVADVFAYYAYNPMPDNIEQRFLYSTVMSVFRIMEDMGKVSEFLGYKELLVFRRDAILWIGALLSPTPESYTDMNITNTMFDGVPVRIYRSLSGDDSSPSPALVYVHGGGFVMCSAALYDEFLVQIVRRSKVVAFSIDYRLAPENPRPAALQDCEAATRYLFTNAAQLGINPQRIGIGGDSAGGNMAAVLALKFQDLGAKPQFSYQVLIYPWVQAMDFNLPSYLENDVYNRPDMKQRGMALYTMCYLDEARGDAPKLQRNQHVTAATRAKFSAFLDPAGIGSPASQAGGDARAAGAARSPDEQLARRMEAGITDPYTFPLMAETLRGVPPALVVTMGLDTLRDEGLLYLGRLREAGVSTQHYSDDLCWHGALIFAEGPIKFECAVRLVDNVIEYIDKAKDKFVSGKK